MDVYVREQRKQPGCQRYMKTEASYNQKEAWQANLTTELKLGKILPSPLAGDGKGPHMPVRPKEVGATSPL